MTTIETGRPSAGGSPAQQAWTSGGDCPYPEATLPELILDQARRTPDAEAVRQWDDSLTYRELVDCAVDVAGQLSQAGVRSETRIGICVARTLALPAAVLGVLMAAAAYVPLDQGHPRKRLIDILDDAGADVVVVDEPGGVLLAGSGRRLVSVAPLHGRIKAEVGAPVPGNARLAAVRPDNAAYVMYTSGSTGRAKGVVVTHRNLVAFLAAAQARRPVGAGCRSAAFASLSFDTSVFDLLLPLTVGATVALVPDEDRVDPARLARFLRDHRAMRAMLPPAVLPLLDPDRLPDLADIFVAGEPCGPEQVQRWTRAGGRRFHNWYGPTETTVIVTGAELHGAWDRPLPIGKPLPGCQAWVLDEHLMPCPPGVAGELHIGGPQLARGYLGQPGLTADRFIPDPFASSPGSRLYRTGDLVRWEPDGTLAYLGRLDRQVKIQGQRVEIGEVEAVLQAHPEVRQAVGDVVHGPAGLKHIVAYVAPVCDADLRAWCASRLPGYMTPTRVISVGTLPLTVSGKIDLAALRAESDRVSGSQVIRAGSVEHGSEWTRFGTLVAQTWAEVFEAAEPGPGEDFHASGGHSLMAMRLVAALRSRSGRQLSVEDLYRGKTVAGIAAILASAGPAHADDAVPSGSPPTLSAAQRRMLFVEQLAPGRPVHNVAMAERLTGPLDVSALTDAISEVARRHEVLRWRFVNGDDGTTRVEVIPPSQADLPVVVLSGRPEEARQDELRELLNREAMTPFDLGSGPAWRAVLMRLAPHEHVLALTVHHAVFDGWSRDVLYREIADSYRAALAGVTAPATSSPVRYADYVAWSAARAQRDGAADLSWWTEHLDGAPLVLDLPRDGARPLVRTFAGAAAQSQADGVVSAAVQAVARKAHATPFAVLLSAFAQLVSRLTGADDLIIGTPAADREHPAFSAVIGLCLHMLPLRLRVDPEASFLAHVHRCQEELTAALAHPGAALERIVESLGAQRDLSRNPVFQVLFNAYDFAGPGLALPGLTATPETAGLPGSLFDLTLYVSEREDRLGVRAVYNCDLYSAARIRALLASYLKLLAELIGNPERAAGEASANCAGAEGEPPGLPEQLPRWAGSGVLERIDAAGASAPRALAVSGHGGPVSYRDLTAGTERAAAVLRKAGVSPGDTVAVLADRDTRLPIVLMGVLATGARWLVVDSALRDPRVTRQLTCAHTRALVLFPGAEPPQGLGDGLVLLEAADLCSGGAQAEAGGRAAPSARGYLSLTSGSTGTPKPVVTSEQPLAHFLDWYSATFALTSLDRFALLAGLGHDPALRDIFTPLAVGGRLCVPGPDLMRDPALLAEWMRAEEITVAHFTPQAARRLAAAARVALPQLRLVALGGDLAFAGDIAAIRALAPNARVVNFYGTTETPQAQAWHDVSGDSRDPAQHSQPVPVGRGIGGAQLIVTDRKGRTAAVGELGEVVIRSRYLASGYLRGVADDARFEAGPADDPGARSFRTGDLGRYRPDGAVVLAGRRDGQLKVRGFRVELGEVEAALAAHPSVRQACVTVTRRAGESQLWAYVVAGPAVSERELLGHLRVRLPDYAVPAGVSLMSALPLTPNGKVDRSALRPLSRPDPADAGQFTSQTERLIAGIWREALGVTRLRPTDNFFDIGGHSMAVAAVHARLTQALGRHFPMVDLFNYPAIRSLAAYLDGGAGQGEDDDLQRAARRGAQRRDQARRRSARQAKGAL